VKSGRDLVNGYRGVVVGQAEELEGGQKMDSVAREFRDERGAGEPHAQPPEKNRVRNFPPSVGMKGPEEDQIPDAIGCRKVKSP